MMQCFGESSGWAGEEKESATSGVFEREQSGMEKSTYPRPNRKCDKSRAGLNMVDLDQTCGLIPFGGRTIGLHQALILGGSADHDCHRTNIVKAILILELRFPAVLERLCRIAII